MLIEREGAELTLGVEVVANIPFHPDRHDRAPWRQFRRPGARRARILGVVDGLASRTQRGVLRHQAILCAV